MLTGMITVQVETRLYPNWMIWIATDFLFVVPFDTVIKEGMVGSEWINIEETIY